MMMRLQGRATNRRSRGFSLLEMVTVAAVSAIIFLILLRWLSTLGGVAGNVATNTASARGAAYVEYRLRNDLSAAAICDPVSGAALRTVDPTTLELYINGYHADGSDGLQLIRWRAGSGILTRTAWDVSLDTRCLPAAGDGTASRVVATQVYTGGTNPLFTALVSGVDAGTCKTVTAPMPGTVTEQNPQGTLMSTPSGDGCFASAVRTHLTFLVPGQDISNADNWDTGVTPVTMDRTYPLPLAAQGGAL